MLQVVKLLFIVYNLETIRALVEFPLPNFWWLVGVTLVVAFGFLPQNFGRWRDL